MNWGRLGRRVLLCGALGARGLSRSMCAQADDWRAAKSIYEFHAKDIDGNDVSLEKYRYAERGLRILGFPCNQFGNQEPGDESQIKQFVANYGVKFDMYSKIEVNGNNTHPLWKWMKDQPKGRGTLGNAIKWNFTKFLINKEGHVVKRYSPMDDPYVIEKDLPAFL
ncbi:retinoic acid receptor responder protein 2 [Platysternon megacephalum]|uniref:Glutathione peroxidase n=1 Tax=Platysternon megacephalum TaxID=55544 RepID=A0A4D9E8D9_9SAUR|nr:retinoic acid receptor responder protein 2 [Platysternon megacephalum]